MDFKDPKKNDSLKEKAAEGWEVLKQQARLWALDIFRNKKKLMVYSITAIIGIFAFIRGLVLILFY